MMFKVGILHGVLECEAESVGRHSVGNEEHPTTVLQSGPLVLSFERQVVFLPFPTGDVNVD